MQGGMAGMGKTGGFGNLGMIWVQEIGHALEGVYLKGQGVIYTATLSSLKSDAKVEKKPTPVSEWESVRRELRNEKEAPKSPEADKPLPLSDVLLNVLAENGRHFSQLADNESLTIVLTVRGTTPSSPARKSQEPPTKSASQQPAGGGQEVAAKVRDLELLGDLHLKQGKYAEAIDAFQKAVKLKPSAKQTASLYRKLAQCYLMLDQNENARTALDRAVTILKQVQDSKDKLAAADKPTAKELPTKLIISAPKKLLDAVAAKNITAAEFRRRANVETLKFDGGRR
jgi:tetratricopeptide (TPR) repeat protein